MIYLAAILILTLESKLLRDKKLKRLGFVHFETPGLRADAVGYWRFGVDMAPYGRFGVDTYFGAVTARCVLKSTTSTTSSENSQLLA